MSNLQNRNTNNRDGNVDENVYLDGNTDPGRVSSYRDGYVHGSLNERRVEDDALEVRDNNNAARGLFIGILVTALAGLTLGAIYFWNQQQQPALVPVVVPVPSSPAPAASQQPNKINKTTVIERQIERVPQVIPVPQQQAPAPKVDVKVNNPPSQTAPKQNATSNVTPSKSPTQSQTENSRSDKSSPSNSSTQTTPSGTGNDSTTTGAQDQTGGTSSGDSSTSGSTTNSNP